MNKGLFLCIEGPDGGGKSLLVPQLKQYLNEKGHHVLTTMEPGGTEIGLKIRSLLLDPAHAGMCPTSELFLYLADRAEHIANIVMPALQKGYVVISDRHSLSTFVYQSYTRGLDFALCHHLNNISTGGLVPDLTFILDVDASIGLSRNVAAGKIDRFEMENLSFHEKVREGFLHYAKEFADRTVVINASQSPEMVFANARAILDNKLDNRA